MSSLQDSAITQTGEVTTGSLANASKTPVTSETIPIPDTARGIATAAFESQLDPLRRGFKDRLETTIGETARRGIAFGGSKGPGAQRVDKLIKTEQELESDIAKNIGAQMGSTLQDQAFIASESAKRFNEAKELLTFKSGLSYGFDAEGNPLTELEANQIMSEFMSGLDITTQEALGDISVEDQKEYFKYTFGMQTSEKKSFAKFLSNLETETQQTMATFLSDLETEQAKDMALFMSDLDTTTQKDMAVFLSDLDVTSQQEMATFLSDLDTTSQKEMATFLTSLETESQKDMATYLTSLETAKAKDLATFTANLDYDHKIKFSDYVQGLKGGLDDDGNPLSDLDIAQKMSNIQVEADKALTIFKNSEIRGVNPETGEAYTDYDMTQIATDLAITQMERQSELNKKLATFQTVLDRGTDEFGEPLTVNSANEIATRAAYEIKNEYASKAMEAALIDMYGPNGVEIGGQLGSKRGDVAMLDLSAIEAIELDQNLTEGQKNEATRLILNGYGPESEAFQNVASYSETLADEYVTPPNPGQVLMLSIGHTELRDYLNENGIDTPTWTSDITKVSSDDRNKVEELWRTDENFRSLILQSRKMGGE